MKRLKMNLTNIKGKLSRAEMKGIMAGSGSGSCGPDCDGTCYGAQGTTCAGVEGTCNRKPSTGQCQCLVVC